MIALAVAIAAAAWLVTLSWLLPRLDRAIAKADRFEAAWSRVDRWLAVQETLAAKPAPVARPPVPTDLLTQAQTAFTDKWAQEQLVAYYRELYADTGDWDQVRAVVNNQ